MFQELLCVMAKHWCWYKIGSDKIFLHVKGGAAHRAQTYIFQFNAQRKIFDSAMNQ